MPVETTVDPASLENLHDIVLPPPVSWWPLATGWYVVAGLLALGLLILGVKSWRRWRENRYRRVALTELEVLAEGVGAGAAPAALRTLPILVKRIALAAYPRADVAALSGEDWLRFLDATGRTDSFTRGPGRALVALAYEPDVADELPGPETAQLFRVVRDWTRAHTTGNLPVAGWKEEAC